MKKIRLTSLIWQIAIRASWAPVLVIVFRWLAMEFHVRKPLDYVIHFSGGLAICYFLYQCINLGAFYTGELRAWVQYLFTFTASCTVALFWEFAELASDLFLGTHIQYNVLETLWDLISGTLGATVTLGLIVIVQVLRKNRVIKS